MNLNLRFCCWWWSKQNEVPKKYVSPLIVACMSPALLVSDDRRACLSLWFTDVIDYYYSSLPYLTQKTPSKGLGLDIWKQPKYVAWLSKVLRETLTFPLPMNLNESQALRENEATNYWFLVVVFVFNCVLITSLLWLAFSCLNQFSAS